LLRECCLLKYKWIVEAKLYAQCDKYIERTGGPFSIKKQVDKKC